LRAAGLVAPAAPRARFVVALVRAHHRRLTRSDRIGDRAPRILTRAEIHAAGQRLPAPIAIARGRTSRLAPRSRSHAAEDWCRHLVAPTWSVPLHVVFARAIND